MADLVLLFLTMRNQRLSDVKRFDQLLPIIVAEADNGLAPLDMLCALLLDTAGLGDVS